MFAVFGVPAAGGRDALARTARAHASADRRGGIVALIALRHTSKERAWLDPIQPRHASAALSRTRRSKPGFMWQADCITGEFMKTPRYSALIVLSALLAAPASAQRGREEKPQKQEQREQRREQPQPRAQAQPRPQPQAQREQRQAQPRQQRQPRQRASRGNRRSRGNRFSRASNLERRFNLA